MNRFRTTHLILAGTVLAAGALPANAQNTPQPVRPRNVPVAAPAPAPTQVPAQAPVVVYQNPDQIPNAREVQEQLRRILDTYPPTVRQLLRRDPTLMQREDDMAPSPALAA